MKVYCENCKYYDQSRWCFHQSNKIVHDNPIRQWVQIDKTVLDVNENNDCKNFKPTLIFKLKGLLKWKKKKHIKY